MRLAAISMLLTMATTASTAQCAPQWATDGLTGTNQEVAALCAWDPDGSGPLPTRLVLGGSFTAAGTILAERIAAWEPATGVWSGLGGADGPVYALATLPTGELVAAGLFSTIGGVAANHIARWNGVTWAAYGAGLGFAGEGVHALAVLPNGAVVAGGTFTNGVGGIAQWNGIAWTNLGSGVPTGSIVSALAVLPNGDVAAGGTFPSIGGVPATNLARWNGAVWSSMGNPGAAVEALAVRPSGALVAAGWFTSIGGTSAARVASWNGTTWAAMGGGAGNVVAALAVLPNGEVLAGGNAAFTAGANTASVARWNGSTWALLTGNSSSVGALTALPNGDIASGSPLGGIDWFVRRWSAAGGWQVLHPLGEARPRRIAELANGDTVAVGEFSVGGQLQDGVAKWSGAAWTVLGGAANGAVRGIVEEPSGDLVVGGDFTSIGGIAAHHVARWNGTTWTPLGAGVGAIGVQAMAILSTGEIVAAAGSLMRWNGATWSTMGSFGTSDPFGFAFVDRAVVLPNGDLVVSGAFDLVAGVSAGNLARWNGTAWTAMPGLPLVYELAVLANGDLLAGGDFDFVGGQQYHSLARWNGAAWTTVGGGTSYTTGTSTLPGIVYAMTQLPDGDLLVGGYFDHAGGVAASHIARWNGTTWSPVAAGTNGSVLGLTLASWGEVFAAGNFSSAGGLPAPLHARLVTPCPATTTALGAGCASSGGGNLLHVVALPWLGGTMRTRATGLPSQRVPIALLGFTPLNVPLVNLFAEALAGCNGHVSPDFAQILPLGGGDAEFALTIPDAPALVGLSIGHQMLVFEVGAGGTSVALTATDAVALSLGDF